MSSLPGSSRAAPWLVARGVATGALRGRPSLFETRRGGRRGYLERAIKELTVDKDMPRAEELYAIQAAEFPEYDMDAEYPEDDAPSEDDSYDTDYDGEGALVDALQRVFSS